MPVWKYYIILFPSLLRTTQIRNVFSRITNAVIFLLANFHRFEKNILKIIFLQKFPVLYFLKPWQFFFKLKSGQNLP
jgi:hypothetical protein